MDKLRIHIKVCKICQKKNQDNKCGSLPTKEAEATPCNRLSIYFTGPYKITIEGYDNPIIPNCLTMIDTITGWFKILQYNDKKEAKMSNPVDQ